ncbi:MAG: oligosaccharide flippase family protein [Chloroflexota bacterium]|nr:oligosaccharide flippase family protein [Chloroflexota bacterium]
MRLVTPLTSSGRLGLTSSTSTPAERSRERYRRAGITTFASVGAQAVATLATLLTVPLALSYLGSERYGVWMSVTSLVAIITAADLGISNGLLNAISKAHGKEDQELARRYISSAFFMLSGIAGLLALIVLVLQTVVSWPHLLNATSAEIALEAQPTALVLLACSLAGIPLGVAARVHLGYQEGFINSLWQGVGSIVGLIGLVVAIALGASLPWLVLAVAGGPVIGGGSNLLVLVRQRDWVRPRWSAVDRDAATRLLKTGLQFAILQAVFAVAFLSDNLVVARIFGPGAAAQYSVHAQLFGLAPVIAAMALSPFWPAYGEALARGDVDWVRKALVRSLLATLVVVGGVSVLFLLTGDYVIQLWVGSRIEPSRPLMLGLALWAILSSMGTAVSMFLNGAGILKLQVVLAVLMAVAALAGKVAFGQTFGLPGVIWGTVGAYALFVAAPLAVLLPRILGRFSTGSSTAGGCS